MIYKKIISTAILSSILLTLNAEDFSLPSKWQGTENKKAIGNPVAGKWGFYQVKGHVTDKKSFLPMIWGGKEWIGPFEFGGQPGIKIKKGMAVMGSRGAWSGEGNAKGHKISALAFIAPKDGKYTLSAKANAHVWQGKKPAELLIMVLKKKGGVEEVNSFELKKGAEKIDLGNNKVSLKKGDMLIIVNIVEHYHTAASVYIRDLKISTK